MNNQWHIKAKKKISKIKKLVLQNNKITNLQPTIKEERRLKLSYLEGNYFTLDPADIKKIIKESYEQLFVHIF